jgi:hypothetical protein
LSVPQEKHLMTMFSSCPGNMWSARSSAPVHQIHNQPSQGRDVVLAPQSVIFRASGNNVIRQGVRAS